MKKDKREIAKDLLVRITESKDGVLLEKNEKDIILKYIKPRSIVIDNKLNRLRWIEVKDKFLFFYVKLYNKRR